MAYKLTLSIEDTDYKNTVLYSRIFYTHSYKYLEQVLKEMETHPLTVAVSQLQPVIE